MKRLKVISIMDNVVYAAFRPMCECGDVTNKPHRCFYQEARDRHPAGKRR